MSNSCNHDLLHARGGEDLAKIYFRASIRHHSGLFISWIERLFSSIWLNCLLQKLICRTQISNGIDRLDPNTTLYRSRFLDRLLLLSNLMWRRAHVTAGLTGMDPNVKICIYGDCNANLLFSYISENKSLLLFWFWDTFARRVLV